MSAQQASERTAPDWLVQGAEVVLYSVGSRHGSQPYSVVKTTVKRVAAKSFAVDDEREPRFPIGKYRVEQGGPWGWSRYVAPLDSDEARTALTVEAGRRAEARAFAAFDQWRNDKTRARRLALIQALQAIDDADRP